MTDIVEWLRECFEDKSPKWSRCGEAADEIERLRKVVEVARGWDEFYLGKPFGVEAEMDLHDALAAYDKAAK